MKLLVDQGNSRLKWVLVVDDEQIVARGASTAALLDDEQWRVLIGRMGAMTVDVAVSSVASADRKSALCADIARRTGVEPMLLSARAECAGLHNGYVEPARLGVDRWVAMLGARSLGPGAWLVVDAGTALTVDAVSMDGQHLGGYIVPGFRTQLTLLASGTAGVGRVPAEVGVGWGRNTGSAVANGVALALAALIDRASVELAGSGDDTCRVVITGGDAELLAHHLRCGPHLDQDLLFRGMLVAISDAHKAH